MNAEEIKAILNNSYVVLDDCQYYGTWKGRLSQHEIELYYNRCFDCRLYNIYKEQEVMILSEKSLFLNLL